MLPRHSAFSGQIIARFYYSDDFRDQTKLVQTGVLQPTLYVDVNLSLKISLNLKIFGVLKNIFYSAIPVIAKVYCSDLRDRPEVIKIWL